MLKQEIELLNCTERLGRYCLLAQFATGGMASVYLARASGTDGFEKIVAIKKIHPHLTKSDHFIRMFVDEARLAAQIHHHNVVQVLELGFSKQENAHYIAMEYVEGETLMSLLRRTGPPWPVAAKIVAEAAAGLHAAHELVDKDGHHLEVVHRDVSPQNILISYAGQVKVLDFGVARAKGSLHETKAGTVQGKFSYMAPEQLRNKPVDRRTDIFALGIVLYETSTRTRLFKAETESETMAKVLHDPIERPSACVPNYPLALENVVLRALDRDPEKRYQSAQEMQEAIEAVLISHGEVVLSSTIAKLMSKTFRDRVKHKKDLLRDAAKRNGSMPDLEIPTGSRSYFTTPKVGQRLAAALTDTREIEIEQDASLTSRRLLLLLLLLFVSLGAGVYFLLQQGRNQGLEGRAVASTEGKSGSSLPVATPDADAQVKEPPPPRPIKIAIKAMPEGATISVDGTLFGNVYEVERPAEKKKLPVVIAADGHHEHRFDVSLESGGSWVIALRPKAASKKPRRKRRWRRAGPKSAKKAATAAKPTKPPSPTKVLPQPKKELVDNPYQQ